MDTTAFPTTLPTPSCTCSRQLRVGHHVKSVGHTGRCAVLEKSRRDGYNDAAYTILHLFVYNPSVNNPGTLR